MACVIEFIKFNNCKSVYGLFDTLVNCFIDGSSHSKFGQLSELIPYYKIKKGCSCMGVIDNWIYAFVILRENKCDFVQINKRLHTSSQVTVWYNVRYANQGSQIFIRQIRCSSMMTCKCYCKCHIFLHAQCIHYTCIKYFWGCKNNITLWINVEWYSEVHLYRT